jgi:secreted trypsin-like serine protease
MARSGAGEPLDDRRRRTIARDAIAHADRMAATNPRAYVEALRAYALARTPAPAAGGGARSLGLRPRAPRGPRLADDPRYLEHVRELARRTRRNARIIGGSTVTGKEFADCVAVGDDDDWGCTGTLIAPTVVLTAGHCQKLHSRIFVGNDVEGRGRQFRVRRHVRHPDWARDMRNDLMLLVLEKAVTGVKPRALARADQIDAAVDGRVVGFGTTDLGGTVGYGRKLQTDVPIVSRACTGRVKKRKDSAVYGCHLGKEIVAGKPLLNHDTCRGDSGGPLYVAQGNRWLLAGVTSRGTDLATSMCGDGGIYTRVDRYRDWIASVIG